MRKGSWVFAVLCLGAAVTFLVNWEGWLDGVCCMVWAAMSGHEFALIERSR